MSRTCEHARCARTRRRNLFLSLTGWTQSIRSNCFWFGVQSHAYACLQWQKCVRAQLRLRTVNNTHAEREHVRSHMRTGISYTLRYSLSIQCHKRRLRSNSIRDKLNIYITSISSLDQLMRNALKMSCVVQDPKRICLRASSVDDIWVIGTLYLHLHTETKRMWATFADNKKVGSASAAPVRTMWWDDTARRQNKQNELSDNHDI